MNAATTQSTTPTLGCVSFLNAMPLIQGVAETGVEVRYDVPSRLLDGLLDRRFDLALCPVIDYQRSPEPLSIVPVGGIGCDGPTLTVRLFSRVPFAAVEALHADTDSHTSVALARVIMCETFGRSPAIHDYRADAAGADPSRRPQTLLLIGDKVVTHGPPGDDYPYQLDLGQAWRDLTGEPFVFAVWMARRDAALGELPGMLERRRDANAQRIPAIARAGAAAHGWPVPLALRYLGSMLRYAVGKRELAAIEHFWIKAAAAGAIASVRPMRLGGEHAAPSLK